MGHHHDRRFPGESDDYRTARDRLLQAEMDLRQKIEEVAALRRRLPPGGEVEVDYEFEEVTADTGEVKPVRLSELFENGDLARDRGWRNLRLLSSFRNRFNEDYYAQYQAEYGEHNPMLNVFRRRNGRILHFWASELFFVPERGMHPRHADQIWPLWNYLDLTPEGRGEFVPRLEY